MIQMSTNQMRVKLNIQKKTEDSQDNNTKEVDEKQSILKRIIKRL